MPNILVTYRGLADFRVLPANDLKAHGVKLFEKDLRFARLVPVELPTSKAFEELLKADGGFAFVASSGESVVGSQDGEAEPETVVDETTGAESKRK